MAKTVRELIDQARRARGEDRPADARRDLVEAATLAREADAPAELAEALMAWGQIERDLGKDGSALPLYEEAVSCRRRADEPLALAHALRHLGDLHRHSERLGMARACYDEALSLYRAQPEAPPLDLANALRPMALLDEREGRAEAAVDSWREAGTLYAEAGVVEGAEQASSALLRLMEPRSS